MGGPVQVIANTEEWKAALANPEGLACIVDFFADWCGPCKMIAPNFVKLAEQNVGKALFLKVNVDDNEEIAQLCGISAMPTFQVWKGGEQVDTILGANLDKLNQLVAKHTA